jgi:hypothetical protein
VEWRTSTARGYSMNCRSKVSDTAINAVFFERDRKLNQQGTTFRRAIA